MSAFPFAASREIPNLESWLRMQDVEKKDFSKSTWIPLKVGKSRVHAGIRGCEGFRKEYHSVECLIVPNSKIEDNRELDWQSISIRGGGGAWCDEATFVPAGCYAGDPLVRYPVLEISFESEDGMEWVMFQEVELALRLSRRDDSWTRPDEDDIEVARLERNSDGRPECLLMKAEFLRDYLAARSSSLLLTIFSLREAVEADFESEVNFETERVERTFDQGSWEGVKAEIHEGGHPFGMEMAVIHAWRESIDPRDDVPVIAHPTRDSEQRSKSYTVKQTGRKLAVARGRLWSKCWIAPASKSPRIGRDKEPSRVHFIVDNQEQKSLSGDELSEYTGWLWFKPSVIAQLLKKPKSVLKWHTGSTGEVGPSRIELLHFGVNSVGLINVLGYKLGQTPEWVQRLWVNHNVSPEGGLSMELHMSQNLAQPATTRAPERIIWHNLSLLNKRVEARFGVPLIKGVPDEETFLKRIHRFYGDSFESVCSLCKELHRTINEQIDLSALNSKIDPQQAEAAKKAGYRQIRRLEFWLTRLGADGRALMRVLAGIADIRQGDAHTPGSSLRDSLELVGVEKNSQDYGAMCWTILAETGDVIANIGKAIQSALGAKE